MVAEVLRVFRHRYVAVRGGNGRMAADACIRLTLGSPAQGAAGVCRFVRIGTAVVVGGADNAGAPSVSRLRVELVVVVLVVVAAVPVDGRILVVAGECVSGGLLDFVRGRAEIVERRDCVLLVVPASIPGDSGGYEP